MSGAKIGIISPIVGASTPTITTVVATSTTTSTVATTGAVLTGGAIIAGGIALGGIGYGYIKIKTKNFRTYLKKNIEKIKIKEEELENKYHINLNYAKQLELLTKEILPKYDNNLFEILTSETKDRTIFDRKLQILKDELITIEIKLKEIDSELEIYRNLIDKLERDTRVKNDLKIIITLHQNISKQQTLTQKHTLLKDLKKKIDDYEIKTLNFFMQSHSSQIEEEKFEEEHKNQKLKREITIITEKIKVLEPNYKFRLKLDQESSRLELLKDEFKVTYAKIKKSKLLKDKLLDLIANIDNPDLNSKVAYLVLKSELTIKEYREIIQEINIYQEEQKEKQERELIANNVIGGLQELGYEIVEEEIEQLKAQKEVYINIDQEYKLKVILQDNSYKIRFTKEVESDEEPTQEERQRDRESIKKWSNDYDKLLILLAQNGLKVEHKIKLEPNIEDIEYLVVKAKNKKRKKNNSTVNYQLE